MFAMFKSKNPYEQGAQALYAEALSHIRKEDFYDKLGVPDTLDGRFDLLVLHLFMAFHVTRQATDGRAFNQAAFDVAFADIDQTLREMGIGDMGVPKHMRRMMTGFNGRMQAYEDALPDKDKMIEALRRNVFGTVESPPQENLEKLYEYVQNTLQSLKAKQIDEIMAGNVEFINP